jgi:4-alpha-glucanotransferase
VRLKRSSGILLHPTSLPGPHGSGDFGSAAYHFVDWLVGAGQKIWQLLPLGGIGPGNSPYMSSSAFAGNLLLIDLEDLHNQGWLDTADIDASSVEALSPRGSQKIDFAKVVPWRMSRLLLASQRFSLTATTEQLREVSEFKNKHQTWLPDYTLFMTLADQYGWIDWSDWPKALAQREPAALSEARHKFASQIRFWEFAQWCFYRQWERLRTYANERGIRIVGDAPIFIAYQSAEVWANPHLFLLNENGKPNVVAGVPPDFFSAQGQRWGNPLYKWPAHEEQNYAWWIHRIKHTFEMVDIVRIDHFRGFEDYWEIPASEPTAINGKWIKGPGSELFKAIESALGQLPIIAEDLGIITPEVDALRREFDFPGMRIFHFAFGSESSNAYLPHNFEQNTVVYTGTHDNNTTQGWWLAANTSEKAHVIDYLQLQDDAEQPLHWRLIALACASVADTAIHPMQDVLGFGETARMNLPGEGHGYWEWRFSWDEVAPEHAQMLHKLCHLYGR